MIRGVVACVLLALALLTAGCAGGTVLVTLHPCDFGSPLLCDTVDVPLDYSGRLPGKVGLHVEELPAQGGGTHPVLLLVAGGPGQPSTSAFDFNDYGRELESLFPGYTLAAYDDRGTGGSGAINCPGLGAIVTADEATARRLVDGCSRKLGASSALYSTRNNSSDMDAVRRALGVNRISLYGVSYGSEQALVYALQHPAHVDRLLLDSMEPPGVDPFQLTVQQELPHALNQIAPHAGTDVAELANRLEAHPVSAVVARPGRTPVHVKLNGFNLVSLAVDSDLNDGIAAELPATVASALRGNLAPLERLLAADEVTSQAGGVNDTVNVATTCSDGLVPWRQDASHAARAAAVRKAVAAVPTSALGLFGRWSLSETAAGACLDWPRAGADPPPRAHALRGIPVLILSGSRDVRTPTAGARGVAAALGHARLLVVSGSGHDVIDSSLCAEAYVRAWLAGRAHGACPRVQPLVAPLGPFPRATGTSRLNPGRTAAVVTQTLRDAAALALAYEGSNASAEGLAGGTLRARRPGLVDLTDYADVAGVTLTGLLGNLDQGSDEWVARVTVGGVRGAHGELRVFRREVTGTLGGRPVSIHL